SEFFVDNSHAPTASEEEVSDFTPATKRSKPLTSLNLVSHNLLPSFTISNPPSNLAIDTDANFTLMRKKLRYIQFLPTGQMIYGQV
ncbi:hypothetical protein HDV05_005628, partial [Chytridiales sp. JEL 0842]